MQEITKMHTDQLIGQINAGRGWCGQMKKRVCVEHRKAYKRVINQARKLTKAITCVGIAAQKAALAAQRLSAAKGGNHVKETA
ncbi:MAG: hypothetical protein FWF47_06765 [Clostridia bacterium]|nr:hypothetical protein [Clostridia bacterium]